MIVAGIMSGTSGDGINVALVQCVGRGFKARMKILAHEEFAYPAAVRETILTMMNASAASVADLARLNFLLGELYARAVLATLKKHDMRCDLIGCHGQTLYHQGEPQAFLGRKLAVTWQTGESAVIAARTGLPVVSDFRTADMAAGGKGAPLVPFLDFLLFRRARVGRIVQNIGGIGNLTAIPAGAKTADVVAFDTGPGNMVIDALMQRLYARSFDKDGAIAATGATEDRRTRRIWPRVCRDVSRSLWAHPQTRCNRHGDLAHRHVHPAFHREFPREAEGLPRNPRQRRRREESNFDKHARRRTSVSRHPRSHHRRARHADRSQGGRCLRAARLPNLASPALERSQRHRRIASGNPRQDNLCVSCCSRSYRFCCFNFPAHASRNPTRWS
jgi:hypothetical protein